jgi:hypothetical protein
MSGERDQPLCKELYCVLAAFKRSAKGRMDTAHCGMVASIALRGRSCENEGSESVTPENSVEFALSEEGVIDEVREYVETGGVEVK